MEFTKNFLIELYLKFFIKADEHLVSSQFLFKIRIIYYSLAESWESLLCVAAFDKY